MSFNTGRTFLRERGLLICEISSRSYLRSSCLPSWLLHSETTLCALADALIECIVNRAHKIQGSTMIMLTESIRGLRNILVGCKFRSLD